MGEPQAPNSAAFSVSGGGSEAAAQHLRNKNSINLSSVGRPPLPPDSYGRLWFVQLEPARWEARTRYRGLDGSTRQYRAIGRSRAAAERHLRTKLNDVRAPADAAITPDSTVAALADAWLTELDTNSELASGTLRFIDSRSPRTSNRTSGSYAFARSASPPLTAASTRFGTAADQRLRRPRDQFCPASSALR
jgi:hypothetical protein